MNRSHAYRNLRAFVKRQLLTVLCLAENNFGLVGRSDHAKLLKADLDQCAKQIECDVGLREANDSRNFAIWRKWPPEVPLVLERVKQR